MNDSDKTKEQLLQESEARYKAIFESAREGILVGIIETRQILYANPAICKMFGYTPEELTRLTINDIHPKEQLRYVSNRFEALVRNEEAFTQNLPCLRKNETVFYADINATSIIIDNKACFVGFFTDTTEHKRTEDALRESEARYKAIFNYATEGIIVADIETKRFKYVNQAACEMFGYTAEQLQQMSVYDIHPKENIPAILAGFEAQARGEKMLVANAPCLHKDGTVFYANINATRVVIDQRPCNLGLFTNITEHKHTEDALRESEARYKAIFDFATEGIVVTDIETKRHKYVNPAACRMFGYTAEEFQRMAVYDIHPKEYMPSVIAGFEAQARGEVTRVPDVPCLHRDGTVFYADIDTTCVLIDKRRCNVGLFTNITKRKQAEEALRQSEEKFRGIAERSFDMIFTMDTEGNFKYISPACEKLYNLKPQDVVGRNFRYFVTKDYLPAAIDQFTGVIKGQTIKPFITELQREEYAPIFVEVNMSPSLQNGKVVEVQGVIRDVTERKKAEEALRESEQRYRTLVEQLPAITYTASLDDISTTLYVSPQTQEMLGVSPDEYTADPNLWQKMIHPDDHDRVMSEIEQSHQTGEPFNSEYRMLAKDGHIVWVRDNAKILRDGHGNPLYLQGVLYDITASKQAEENLRQSEEKFRGIAERSFDVIFTTDTNGNFKYVSPACEKLYSLKPEAIIGKNFRAIATKSYLQPTTEYFKDILKGRILKPLVTEMQGGDGPPVFVEVNMSPVLQNGKVVGTQGVVRDITERKKNEELLRQSEEKFRGIAERSFDMIFMTDARGFITYLSPASERIFGYEPQEMVGKNFTNFLVESEIPKAVKRFTEKLQGKKLGDLCLEAKKKDGSRVFIELISSLIIQDGKTAGTQGIIKDITERRKAEEQLQKAREELEIRVKQRTADLAKAVETLQKEVAERKRAEESLRSAEVRFKSIFENTIVGLYRTTPGGQILLANPALVKMMGCRSFKELAKFNVEKNGFDPSTPRSIFKNFIKKEGRVIGLECVWRRPNGTKLFVLESAFAVKDAKGKVLYYEGTAQDITQRKEAEEKLMLYQQQLRSLASELSLAEERLRRRIAAELHDHIAQNLAISKIKLESLAGDTEPNLTKSLNEVIDLISQTIDTSRSLTFEISPPVLYELGFEAAVGWLARQTRQRFGLDVEFINDEKPKPLNADIRVLLFQAVRELLVNIVKHAKAKKVKIYARAVDDNIQVTVEDDGIGFDITALNPVKDFTKGGFGLFNIRERLDQIGGSVIIHSGRKKGTQITMTAPIEKQKKPRTRFSGTRSGKNSRRRKTKK